MNSMNNGCIVTTHVSSFNLRCETKFIAVFVVGFSFCERHLTQSYDITNHIFNGSGILNVLDNFYFKNAVNNSSLN